MLRLLLRQRNPAALDIMSESLLVDVKLTHKNCICLSTRLDLEETVHGFEWDALGLRDQEPHEDDGEDHQGGEEEVDAVTHGCEHLRREARDHEVPEPVGAGGEGLAEGADVLWEHLFVWLASVKDERKRGKTYLGIDDPGCSVP
jgi:hypothetical protein